MTILKAHLVRRKERLAYSPAYAGTGHVFCREDGATDHPDAISKSFTRTVRAAGLATMSLHGLRHLHGSILLRAGVALHVVSLRLGHADPAFTAKVYARVLPQQGADAIELFAKQLRSI